MLQSRDRRLSRLVEIHSCSKGWGDEMGCVPFDKNENESPWTFEEQAEGVRHPSVKIFFLLGYPKYILQTLGCFTRAVTKF